MVREKGVIVGSVADSRSAMKLHKPLRCVQSSACSDDRTALSRGGDTSVAWRRGFRTSAASSRRLILEDDSVPPVIV